MLITYLTYALYITCFKPLFFLFEPEKVHNIIVKIGAMLGRNTVTRTLMKLSWAHINKNNMKKIDGIVFPGIVGLSAGFDYNGDLVETLPAMGFGFHTVGTVTFEPYDGNPPPRLVRFPKSQALLVNKGLKNLGAKAILEKLLKQKITIPLGISIASTNRKFQNENEQISDIIQCFTLFEHSPLQHSYYELNISCPNTFGGEPFTTPKKLQKLITKMDELKLHRPLYVKMPIDQPVDETLSLLKVLNNHNVQGVIFGNLTKDHNNPAIHPDDKLQWQNLRGNVSGKPTWKRSNDCITLCRAEFGSRFTIIGAGGVFNGDDAEEKLNHGADLIQLITGFIYQGPQLIGQINHHLAKKKFLG